MQKSTIIYIVTGVVILITVGVGVYILRLRSLEGLEPLGSVPTTGTSQQVKPSAPPGSTTVQTQGAKDVLPPAAGQGTSQADLDAFASAKSQYTNEEQQNLTETIHGEQMLPKDVSKTWSPEFQAQMDAQQRSRR